MRRRSPRSSPDPARLSVNQFGVDPQFWSPAGEREDYVLAIGNDPRRDYQTLLAAAPEIRGADPPRDEPAIARAVAAECHRAPRFLARPRAFRCGHSRALSPRGLRGHAAARHAAAVRPKRDVAGDGVRRAGGAHADERLVESVACCVMARMSGSFLLRNRKRWRARCVSCCAIALRRSSSETLAAVTWSSMETSPASPTASRPPARAPSPKDERTTNHCRNRGVCPAQIEERTGLRGS